MQSKQLTSNPTTLPWYRYGMVWIVILLPVSVVIASMFTIAVAFKNAPIITNKPIEQPLPVLESQIRSTPER